MPLQALFKIASKNQDRGHKKSGRFIVHILDESHGGKCLVPAQRESDSGRCFHCAHV